MLSALKSKLKPLIAPPLRQALKTLLSELSIETRHRQALQQSKTFRQQKQLKLNCGSGQNLKANWINIDFSPQADLQLDLRRPMPFADQSVECIYSEHFLEHLQYPDDVGTFFSECFRVLAPGGVLHLGVPDSVLAINSYVSGDHSFLRHNAEGFLPDWCDTPMHWLNMHFSGGGAAGHKYGWDWESLQNVLQKAGFTNIRQRNFDPSLDSAYRKDVTLYVVASRS